MLESIKQEQVKRMSYFYYRNLDKPIIISNFAPIKHIDMTNTEYITIKNASRKVLQRMRQIGVEKAQRLQEVQKRWDSGEYKNAEVVQL